MAEDRLTAMGAAEGAADEGISLETLPEEAVEKIMTAYRKGRDAADSYYRSKVEPALLRRLDVRDELAEIVLRADSLVRYGLRRGFCYQCHDLPPFVFSGGSPQ